MGNASSTNSVVIDTSVALSSLTQSLQTNSASTLNSVTGSQDVTVNIIGSVIKNSKINLNQTVDTTTNTSGKLKAGALTTVAADMKTTLNDAIDQAAKSSTGFLATGSSESDNKSKVKAKISEAVDSITSIDNYTKIVNDTVDTQAGTINIKDSRFDGSTLTYDQTIVAKSIAVNMIDSVLSSASNALSTTDQTVSIKQKAESDAGGIFGSLGLLGMLGAAGGFVCCCVCLCISLLLSLYMASQSQGSNGSSRA
jgi:hypothetical protein